MNISEVLLYGVTCSRYDRIPLEKQVEAAVKGGAEMIQLREKGISLEEYVIKAKRILEITRKMGALLIINDSIEAACLSGADGVHLGQSDGDPEAARKILGKNAVIGVTAKTPEQALSAQEKGADYLGSGAMFVSPTKPDAVALTVSELSDICSAVKIPVFAIGGITSENAKALCGSGISGIAVVSSLFGADNTEEITANAVKLRTAAAECVND